MIGVKLGLHLGSNAPTLLHQALSAIRRNNGTALYIPDDYGLVLGPELAGSLSVGTPASVGAYAPVTFGTASAPIAAGKQYRFSISVSAVTSGSLVLLVGDTQQSVYPSSPGNYTFVATTSAVNQLIQVNSGASGFAGTIASISVREILSATTYIDSTGTQPVTAIGDLVGLLTDRSYGAGNLGVELNPTGTAGWAPSAATVVDGGATLSITNTSASYGYAYKSFATVVGKTYRIKANATNTSGVRPGYIFAGTSPGTITNGQLSFTSTGERQFVFVASATTTIISLYAFGDAVGNSATYQQISLVEVLGNHASQPTTASKPVVTRVPKRLGPNLVVNGGFDTDTSGWTAKAAGTTMSVVSGAMRVAGTGAWVETYTSFPTVSGRTYRFAANVVAATTNVRANLSSTAFVAAELGNGVATTSAGGRMYYEFTAASATIWLVLRNNGTGPETFDVDNITVQEVLEWSNALKFDGSNDLLTLSSGAILQQGSDHFVTAAFVLDAVGATQTIYAASNTANGTPFVAWFYVDGTTNKLSCSWRDDAGVNVLPISSAVLSAGVPYVVTAARVGGSYTLWLNGVVTATQTATLGATTLNTANIGALVRTSTANYLNGKLIDIAIGQSTLTEADRKTIERNMAQKAGVTYVG